MSSIQEIQDNIKSGQPLINYSAEEIKYIQTPIGKGLYRYSEKKVGRPKIDNKKQWNDKIKCELCGKTMLRSNQSSHNKSQYHIAHEKINSKLRHIILE